MNNPTGWRKERRSLAVQVRDLIWSMIQQEKYRPGDRLPSEQELVQRYGISRGALREALKILEEERVVLCQHGVGRFVAPNHSNFLSEDITRLKSMTELARSLGFKFTTQVLSVKEVSADETVQVNLNLEPGTPVVILERVWGGPSDPIIYSIDIFPRDLIPGLLSREEFSGSLLQRIESQTHTRLEYSKSVIRAVHLDPDLVRQIGANPLTPWILLEQINYDSRDTPILYSRDYHSGEKFQFRVLRRRR